MSIIKSKTIFMKKINITIILFFILTINLFPQFISNCVPDTGSQSFNYPFRLNGTGSEWTISPYYVIDFWGGGVTADSIHVVNDSVILAHIYIDPKAPVGFKTVRLSDAFLNSDSLVNGFEVFLYFPAQPALLYPFNNSNNIPEITQMIWDSNATVNSYRLQIANDSLFSSVVYDTNVTIQYITLRTGVLSLGQKYYWRVRGSNSFGIGSWSEVWNFRVRTSSIQKLSGFIPDKYFLEQNYPNPFNPSTNIKFQIPKSERVTIKIFDLLGREMETLLDSKLEAGYYQTKLVIDQAKYSSGIYFYMLKTESMLIAKKMVILK